MNIMWWLIWIWFGYVLQLADTGFEISTAPDADKYGLAYSPSIYLNAWKACNAV